MSCPCYIVPPHFLQAIADSSHNSEHQRSRARAALEHRNRTTQAREQRLDALEQPENRQQHANRPQPFIPQQVLERLANSDAVDQRTRDRARRDLDHARRRQDRDQAPIGDDPKDAPYRAVYDAGHTEDESKLPGKLLRAEGEPPVSDEAANEALDNAGLVIAFYKDIFNWNSIDNKNMDVISSVHYSTEYENACKCSHNFVSTAFSLLTGNSLGWPDPSNGLRRRRRLPLQFHRLHRRNRP